MKQGWEIKRLCEVCDFFNGFTPKEDDLSDNGTIPYFKVSDMNHSANTKYLKHTSLYLDKGCKTYPKESIVFPKNGAAISTNKKRILAQDSVVDLNTGGVYVNKSIVSTQYLYLYFINTDFNLYTRRGAVPTLDIAELKNKSIHIPPLPEQQKIVEELDCLSNMIELKKKQLETYDKLAQAIFYDMFGDPITNEKGWKERSLTDVCTNLFVGGDVPKGDYSETKTEQHSIPILSNGVGDKALYGYTSKPRVNEVSLTISGRGTIGYCEVRTTPFLPVVRLIVATPNTDIILPITLKFIVDALKLKGTGGTIPQLTIPMIKNKKVFLPPIGIQQEFASKIEALEKQKELIKQSLSETEMLFNSRMDYYFN